ncbi:DUF3073 domain-containing protein [Paeniglutamicibacter cryotolerans]|uniref:DUF3073 domain-containing protein n=1 Tax=Paeniglutamicibacter cryotolerans TaxID=670079 RepID=A0A839QF47_9MICC|nr:DUF3073 domain-containing protein [Paeniglutamicibacter cryotolerans]MBB2994267.1 hypothetical protein [Paeniglutamicibacter cryotolerans]
MGRGRQKAKATRQARDIKYFSPATDLSALERELGGTHGRAATPHHVDVPVEPDYSGYDDTYGDDDDEDDQRRIG